MPILLIFIATMTMYIGCNKRLLNTYPKSDIRPSPRISQGHMANGIQFFYMKNEVPARRCYLRMNIKVGSFFEGDDELGAANLIRYLACEDRAITNDIMLSQWLKDNTVEMGLSDLGLVTTEETIFKLDLTDCRQKNLRSALGILHSIAEKLAFELTGIDSLKKQLAEEESSTKEFIEPYERLIHHMLPDTPYETRPVLGKREVRENISPEILQAFYDSWYRPDNISLVLVGDYEEFDPTSLLNEVFASMSSRAPLREPKSSFAISKSSSAFIIGNKKHSKNKINYTIQRNNDLKPSYKKNLLKERMAYELALSMLNQQLLKLATINEQGLFRPHVYGSMFDIDSFELMLSIDTTQEELENDFMRAFWYLLQAKNQGFSSLDFIVARSNYFDALDRAVMNESITSSDTWANTIVDQINRKLVAQSPLEYQAIARPLLEDMSPKDCQSVLRKALDSGNEFIFALGSMDESPENNRSLIRLLEKAKAQSLDMGPPLSILDK